MSKLFEPQFPHLSKENSLPIPFLNPNEISSKGLPKCPTPLGLAYPKNKTKPKNPPENFAKM